MIEINKNNRINSQKFLKEHANNAWIKTIKELYFPPLNEPLYTFDYTRKEGFFIDPMKWQITMNLANTPPFTENEEYIKYFHAIMMHEVSHYQLIPYDGLTNARLLRMAMKHVKQFFAPIVVNIFSDLVIDTKLFHSYPDLMRWEIQTTYNFISQGNTKELSTFSIFLLRAYEKIFNFNFLEREIPPELEILVDKVIKIIFKDFEDDSKWGKKVSRIAFHLKGLIKDTFKLGGSGIKTRRGKPNRNLDGRISIEVPEDVLEIMDDPFESKNSDKLKQDKEEALTTKAEEFAKNVPYSEFGAPARQAGILIEGRALSTWYRGIAKDLIKIKINDKKPSGKLPIYPQSWRIGDPLEQLDIPLSLSNYPIMIPNITTKKWNLNEGIGLFEEKQLPDILIVIDSSGSMKWNLRGRSDATKGAYHTAVLASFAALHHAASKGAKFSVINFSNMADICQWTNDSYKAEITILRYQGGGTVLPLDAIKQQCDKAERMVLVLLITDFGINNWGRSKKILLDIVNNGHYVVGFFIGASDIPEKKFKSLLEKVNFYPINNINDLIDLVIINVKNHYSD